MMLHVVLLSFQGVTAAFICLMSTFIECGQKLGMNGAALDPASQTSLCVEFHL